MSGILGEICHLFCCPPRPSHIVAKLAFLPPPPTYSIISSPNDSDCRIEFKPEAGWHMSDDTASKLSVFYTMTKRRSRIVCMYISASPSISPFNSPQSNLSSNRSTRRVISPIGLGSKCAAAMSASCPVLSDDVRNPHGFQQLASTGDSSPKPPFTVLFSHGNAVDIGQMAGFLQSLAYRFGVNIMCYDYSGYGVSTGQRLEENLYADAEAVLRELCDRYHVPLDRIVLYGQSIGTAPTVDLATKFKVAGVVLHSPFMSGLRVVCPGTTRRFCFDPFTNIDKVSRILSPTLIIHGTDDEIIGIHHGRELFSRLAHPLEPAWIDGAGHNDIELFSEYAVRLDRFFNEDLAPPNIRCAGGDHRQQIFEADLPIPLSNPSLTHSASSRKRSSLRHPAPLIETVSTSKDDSLSTIDTVNIEKSDTCTESLDSVHAAVDVGEMVEKEQSEPPESPVTVDRNNSKTSVSQSSMKRRVWTMRKESSRMSPAARSKTIHNVVMTRDLVSQERSSFPTGRSASVPDEAIPRPPPLRSSQVEVRDQDITPNPNTDVAHF